MAKLNAKALEEAMAEAELPERYRKKLRATLESKPAAKPRGQGAVEDDTHGYQL